MSRVVHFEMMAYEPERAIDFYSKVLDWKFQKWANPDSDYWLISTGDDEAPGINGGLTTGKPVSAVVKTIGVADLDATLDRIEENGGRVIRPRVSRPGMGWYASFEDPVGNQFGLLQAGAAENDCPETVEDRQQSLPGCSDDRVRPRPQAGRTTSTRTTRKTARTPRPSPARTSRTKTGSSRPRTRAGR